MVSSGKSTLGIRQNAFDAGPVRSYSAIMRENQAVSSLYAALSRLSLARQLMLLVLASSVPLLLLSLFMFNLLVANERDSIRERLVVNARTLAGLVDNEIDTHAAIGSTLAQSPSLQRGDLTEFRKEAERALQFVPGSWVTVTSPDGNFLLSTLVPDGRVQARHPAPQIVERGFAERRFQVSDLVFGPVAQRWTALVELPVFRDDTPIYSVQVALSPQRFLDLLKTRFTHGEVVAIVDRSKKFVARVPEVAVGQLSSDGWRAGMARAPTGWVENKKVEGHWSLTGYASTQYGWTAGIAQLESDIAGPLDKIFWTSALVAGTLLFLSLAIAVLIGRHASRGMSALVEAAQALGEGGVVAAPPAPFSEARTIGATLAEVSLELRRRGDIISLNREELERQVAQRTSELKTEIQRRNETENTLRQVQKIDSIGQLTGGIAHDFNNMLTIIMGNLDTVQRRLKSLDNSAVLSRPIEAALYGARNAAKLTHRLLAFSRQQALEPVSLDLNALLASLGELLQQTVGETIKVEAVSGAGLWSIFADVNQIENALVNLAINARDAMPDGGKLTIESANAFLDEAYVARFGDLKDGQYVMLSVSDTGTGIAPDVLEKVFDPFFSTKEPGKGTGLGLSMIHGFIKQSHGHVRIYSEPGQGTTVKMYLPRLADPSAKGHPLGTAIDEEKPAIPANPGETILLVEDDIGVREYATGVLEDLGYRILAASQGSEAIQIVTSADRIDLLFTDVVLGGGMTGKQLADQIGELRPLMPVLFTTGYTRNAIVHHGHLDAGVNLLNKPYTRRDLSQKIREILERTNSRRSL